jgi:nitric oxide reductase subunit B
MGVLRWLDRREQWWKVFVVISVVSLLVVGYVGKQTYDHAPPVADFVDEAGQVVIPRGEVSRGQSLFLRYGLMDYGSFLGDGGLRGPDFTAEALRETGRALTAHHEREWASRLPDAAQRSLMVSSLVQAELKRNRYDAATDRVTLGAGQVEAFRHLVAYYGEKFGRGGEVVGVERFQPGGYVEDPSEVRALAAFFFWGGWLCVAERPGQGSSYTHNWPYEPALGNAPTAGVVFWSVIGGLVLVLAMGVVFYLYGRMDRDSAWKAQEGRTAPLATAALVDRSEATATQRACYKFFAVAALLFVLQVTAGLLTLADFVGFFRAVGVRLDQVFPVTVTRAWHTQISLLWIAVCWFGASIWVLPLVSRPEPRGQPAWVNALFTLLVVVALGTVVGVPLGVHGLLGDAWRWLGLQGWEFVQLGRLFHVLLYVACAMWLVIVARGVWPVLRRRQTWSLPAWMVYAIAGILLMFSAGFVAGPETNFVIADFWRWCTIHMWAEAFFEVFTTILVAYFMYLMGFVSHAAASRVVYLAAVLFLGSGLIGISHNFYWNAKSMETVALGGVLSTLQVVPLVLLTVEAWRFRRMPESALSRLKRSGSSQATFGLAEAFLFLLGVNFWNFLGAGVFGFSINLPIVNYYQHGNYLTVNHGHAALFGVYGNLAIGAMLFCGRWMVDPGRWNPRLLRTAFVSLNVGLMLMVVMDLLPVGVDQLVAVLDHGYAYARSEAYVQSPTFQAYAWLRSAGILLFVVGGVVPIAWFLVTRWGALKPAAPSRPGAAPPPEPSSFDDRGAVRVG